MSFIALAVGVAAIGAGAAMSANAAGKKKKELRGIADTPGLDIGGVQSEAIEANLSNLADAESLASKVNQFNQDELIKQLRAAIPNFDEITGGVGQTIESLVSGELPKDVRDAMVNFGAERNVASGLGSRSEIGANRIARDLGLTRLQLQGQGLDAAMRWLQVGRTTLAAPQFDVTSQFISPAGAINLRSAERSQRMNLNAAAAMQKGGNEIWGGALQQVGGMLVGAGAGAALGGGGGGMFGQSGTLATGIGGMGYQVPSNYGTLPYGQQLNYYNMLQRNSQIPGGWE
jgi:hypothetical protein